MELLYDQNLGTVNIQRKPYSEPGFYASIIRAIQSIPEIVVGKSN